MTTPITDKRARGRAMGTWLVIVVSVMAAPSFAAAGAMGSRDVRDLVAAAVSERLGSIDSLEIEVLEAPADAGAYESATPATGARLGGPMRFTLAGAGLPTASLLAHVSVVAAHVVVVQPIGRNVAIAGGDVEVRHARLEAVLLQPLPSLNEVLGARARRALAAGEVLTVAVVARTPAVRAGEEVSITIRSGAIEARGIGRATSSGFVGDVIRVTRPGSREPARARVLAPASVEIVQ